MASGQIVKKKNQTKSLDYPRNKNTQKRYDNFCMAYHTNGRNGAAACVSAGYSERTARQCAVKLLSIPYIQEKLESLQDDAQKEYTITVEQRLKWLERVVSEGFAHKVDSVGNSNASNLQAVISSIAEQNRMLGTTSDADDNSPTLAISYTVNDAKADVTVTNAKS